MDTAAVLRIRFWHVLSASAVLQLAAVFVINPVWGNYDAFAAVLMSGTLGLPGITDSYVYGAQPLAHAIGLLHEFAQTWPWTGIVLLGNSIITYAIAAYLLLLLLRNKVQAGRLQIALWLSWLTLLYGYSFTEFSGTGFSFLISATGLLAIWHVQLYAHIDRPTKWFYTLLLSLYYVTAYFYRSESGIGGTVIAGLFVLIYERSVIKAFKIAWLPGLLAAIFFVRFWFILNSMPFLKEVEPMIFYVTDSKNQPAIIARDSVDEIKIQAIKGSFFSDTSVLNVEYYKYLTSMKTQSEEAVDNKLGHFVKVAFNVSKNTIAQNKALALAFVLVALWLFVIALQAKDYWLAASVLVFNLAIAGIIATLAFTLKMEKWHFVPITQTALLCNALMGCFVLAIKPSVTKSTVTALLLLGLSIGMFFHLYADKMHNNQVVLDNRAHFADIMKEKGKRLLFLDMNSHQLLDNFVFTRYPIRKQVYFYDTGQLDMLPECKQTLDSLCNCNSAHAGDFFNYMNNNHNKAIYVKREERAQFLSTYAGRVHRINLNFISIGNFQANIEGQIQTFNIYVVEGTNNAKRGGRLAIEDVDGLKKD